MSKILVVSPHADDSEYGAGGAIIRYLSEGHSVHISLVVATAVDFIHNNDFVIDGETRVKEFRRAIDIYSKYGKISYNIWVTDQNNDYEFGLESRLDAIPIRDVVNFIEGEINDFKPDVLYFPSRSHHQDHRTVYEACITACRPTQPFLPSEMYLYELPTSFWNNHKENYIIPNTYIIIDIDKKMETVSAHSSQIRPKDNKLSSDSIIDQAKVRGDEVSEKYCEAFELIRRKI